jgi:hypothetical protein
MFLASLRCPELRQISPEDPGELANQSTSFPRPLPRLFRRYFTSFESGWVLVEGGSGKGPQARKRRKTASSVHQNLY